MINQKFKQALAIFVTALSFSSWANVGFNFSGQLDATSPTYNRVSDRTSAGVYLDSTNNALPYTVLEIRTSAVGDTVSATVNNTTAFDSFLSLYSSFNPANPAANILVADDDSAGYPHASLTRAGLAANTSYFLVITSYSGSADSAYPLYGNYDLTLSGASLATYAITAAASPLAGGSVSCSPNPVLYGASSTCTATPSSGYTFSTFSGDCTGASCTLSNVTSTRSVTAAFTLIAPTITLSPTSLPAATDAAAYSQTITASGGTSHYSYSVTAGALPAGLSLSSAGVLSGTPTAGGSFNFTVTATDSSTGAGPYTGSRAYSLTVSNGPTSYTAPSPTGTGSISVSIAGGGAGCGFTNTQFVPTAPGAIPSTPRGFAFLHGLFDFSAASCTGTVTLTVTYPHPLPPGTKYWKYGPTSTDGSNHWYQIPATISGNTITFSITDGGLGDDDFALGVNGTIIDVGGAGSPDTLVGATSIPTLSDWGLIILSGLIALAAMMMRRRVR